MRVVRRDPDKGYLAEMLWVPKKYIPEEATKAALSFSVMDDRKMRFLTLFKETRDHLLIPREFWDVSSLGFEVVDCRQVSFPVVNVRSKIVLDAKKPSETTQRDSVKAMAEGRGGILQLACGKGKTVCALHLISIEKVPALIVVDNTHLLAQWTKEINKHLDIPSGLGVVRGKNAKLSEWMKDVVITTYTTLAKVAEELPEEIRRRFGLVIWDEAHHMAAPTWAVSADLFVGKRIGLTATPTRVDGMHVIYDFHLGPVLYKDLSQDLTPEIYFMWTGLEVDQSDPKIKEKVCDVNGELHISMLSSYFGQWRQRMEFILNEVQDAAAQGRKILVLSYSLAELVNMCAMWNGAPQLFMDLPPVTPQDVGETLQPVYVSDRDLIRLKKKLGELIAHQKELCPQAKAKERKQVQFHIDDIMTRLKQFEVYEKMEREEEKRLKQYVKEMLPTTQAGLMIGAIKPEERAKMLEEKQVTFAIMKYGREGLDEPNLDTVFVCEAMSQRNALQQLMGRVLRLRAGKKQPIVVFFEDNIGPMMGMCKNLRKHLNEWPLEEGGPFKYELVGHPRKGRGYRTWGPKT